MVTPCSSDQTSCALELQRFCRDAKNREARFLSACSGAGGGCSALDPLVGIPHKEVRQHLLAAFLPLVQA